MSWKEGTKRLNIHVYPGPKRPDLGTKRHGTKRPGYEVLNPSRLLRIQFSADLTMYWFPVYYFRCMKFKPLVIWIWNQNIAISTIVGTWSQITLLLPKVSIIQIQSKLPLLLRSMHRGLNRFHRHRGHAAYILLYIRVL